MSTPEQHAEGQVDSRSSVKVVRNAKGDTQVEVKIYAGEEDSEVERVRALAVQTYQTLLEELQIAKAAA